MIDIDTYCYHILPGEVILHYNGACIYAIKAPNSISLCKESVFHINLIKLAFFALII